MLLDTWPFLVCSSFGNGGLGQLFRTFRDSFSTPSSSLNLFRQRDLFFENLADTGAIRLFQKSSLSTYHPILTIFWPFEILQKFAWPPGPSKSLKRVQNGHVAGEEDKRSEAGGQVGQ